MKGIPKKKVWTIHYDRFGFSMTGPDGEEINRDENRDEKMPPRKLSAYAFDKGADAVVHDYDLKRAEDLDFPPLKSDSGKKEK